jgi:hypothetical protein
MKKMNEQHQKEMVALQEKFNKQLERLQQQQNINALEAKFDKLMEMMMTNTQSTILRESPIRKKGKPNDTNTTIFAHTETPTRSNRHDKETTTDTEMQEASTDESTESRLDNHSDTLPYASVAANKDYPTDSESEDSGWITTNKRKKKVPKMTQTKLRDMMTTGGYGPRKSLFQTDQSYKPRPGHSTPPRAGQGTPTRQHPLEAYNNSTVHLEQLSSTRSDNPSPRERES